MSTPKNSPMRGPVQAQFESFPKIARLRRDVVITEKIDGTNAAIVIEEHPFGTGVNLADDYPLALTSVCGQEVGDDGLPLHEYFLYAQSRTRMITVDKDNFGFAAWVQWHAVDLAYQLGEGRHFGEWWGAGIQRRYGQPKKRFSLFNTHRWNSEELDPELLSVVPVIYEGPFTDAAVQWSLDALRSEGSFAAPGFMQPEGVVLYHRAANEMFKILLENDEVPKSLAGSHA